MFTSGSFQGYLLGPIKITVLNLNLDFGAFDFFFKWVFFLCQTIVEIGALYFALNINESEGSK